MLDREFLQQLWQQERLERKSEREQERLDREQDREQERLDRKSEFTELKIIIIILFKQSNNIELTDKEKDYYLNYMGPQ